MNVFDVLTLLGGLALFLFGMNTMGDGLEKAAGNQLKAILEKLTSSPVRGFFLGLAVTAVIQSSSATTVMVVGFVSSGVMTLYQAVGIIMGANVGTTVTAWILSLNGIEGVGFVMKLLKPTSFSPVLAVIGIALLMFAKNGRKKDLGTILIGFATLMFGMNTMSTAVAGLKDVPEFANILLMFSNPILGVLAGAILTAIIQSSSASVGILQALSSTGAVTFGSAIPIILGQNIGTTVTALLSSAGAPKNARRAALVHLYFNVIGTVVFLVLFYILKALIPMPFLEDPASETGISVVHTLFNVVCTCAMLPFSRLLVKLAYLTIREEKKEDEVVLLDERLLVTPTIALEQCNKLACGMANLAHTSARLSTDLLREFDAEKAATVDEIEDQLDQYEDIIGTFLVKLSSHSLSMEDSRMVSLLLHTISDLERISDHAKSVRILAQRLSTGSGPSAQAEEEMKVLVAAVSRVTKMASDAFIDHNSELAKQVEPLEQVVDYLCGEIKARHIARLQNGVCSVESGMQFTDVLGDLARISDHCSNVAAAVIELNMGLYDTHQYLGALRSDNEDFRQLYAQFRGDYVLPSAT